VRNNQKNQLGFSKQNLEDLVFYITLGIIVGGRLGYALFYGGAEMWLKPWHLLELWKGGMSFHGGIAGVIIASWLFARRFQFAFLKITDLVALYAPIGMFLGRCANFVNDELWGRVTDVPWAIRFPSGGYLPRHPSQLYEAFFEGIVLFVLLNFLWRWQKVRQNSGIVSAVFVLAYGLFRMAMEQFRQPDAQLGFFLGSVTMGQILSIPLILCGIVVLWYKLKKD
jgi:phosphatidylglycerol:prolipoprotein diacylglycerol transferase